MKHVEGKSAGVKMGQLSQEREKTLTAPGQGTVDPYRLYEENRGLAYGALQRYFPRFAADEDLQQQACLALWNACRSYDPGRGSFSTLAYSRVRRELLAYLRGQSSQKRRAVLVSLDRPEIRRQLTMSADGTDWADTEGFYRALGKERYKRIVSMRQAGLGNQEIAVRLGVARTTVTRDLAAIRKIFEAYI